MSSFKTSISQHSNCSSTTINNNKTQCNKYIKKHYAEKSPKRKKNYSIIIIIKLNKPLKKLK
jgi:hypothetical protein